jgi:hypothetical protein
MYRARESIGAAIDGRQPLISMAAALARALAAQAAAVVQTTAFRRRALQVAV